MSHTYMCVFKERKSYSFGKLQFFFANEIAANFCENIYIFFFEGIT